MPNEQNRNTPLPVVVSRTPSLRVQDLQPLVPQATALIEERRSRTLHIIGETRHPDRTRERRCERGWD